MGKQFHCARQRANLPRIAQVNFFVLALKTLRLFGAQLLPRLSQQGVDKQSSAHPDPAVDAPDSQLYARHFERLPPRQNVLVNAVDQRAVQVEQKGWSNFFQGLLALRELSR